MITVEITAAPINANDCIKDVADDGAGAISTFIGTTRDTFDGKPVLGLKPEKFFEVLEHVL